MKKPKNPSMMILVCAFTKCQRGPRKTRARFAPSRPHQKYCSDACRYRDWYGKRGTPETDPSSLARRIKKLEQKIGV